MNKAQESLDSRSIIEIEEETCGQGNKGRINLSFQVFFSEGPEDSQISSDPKSPPEIDAYWEEYKTLQKSFICCKPTKEMLDQLENLAEKGIDEAAIDIGHYAMEHLSEHGRAKKLLKNSQFPYATHLLGVLASHEDDEELALELFCKAFEMGVFTSLTSIVFAVEENPALRSGKYAEQINKALLQYHNFD